MVSVLRIILILALSLSAVAQKTILDRDTVGSLPANRVASIPGSTGQLLFNNAGAIGAEDPIISFNYVNLFSAVAATGTQTSSTVRVSTFGQFGTLYFTWASITGSPSGCTVQIKSADSLGNLVNNGSAISVTPSNGSSQQYFSPSVFTAGQMQAVYSCSVYPSAGTLTLDFVPGLSVGILNTPLPISATSLPLPTGAAQDSTLTGGTLKAQPFDGTNVIGTSAHPVRTDPTGTTTQPVSATSLPLPTGASQEHAAANSPSSVRLTDGAAFYKPTTPSDTQPVSAASLPLPSGAAQDSSVTAPEFSAGTTSAPSKLYLIGGKTSDATPQYQPIPLTNGGAAVKTDSSTTTQPVSAASLPLPSGASTSGNQTNGTQKTQVVDGSGNVQPAGDTSGHSIHTTVDAAPTTTVTGTVTGNQGTANTLPNAWPVKVTDGTNTMPTGDASARSIHTTIDNSSLAVTGTFFQGTQPVSCASGATCPTNSTLQAGSAVVGKVGLDTTTPGTTNATSNYQPAGTTGTITANGQTVSVATTGQGTVSIYFNGTYAGITVAFEESPDGGTTWYADTSSSDSASILVNSAALTNNSTVAFSAGVYSATNFRIRATAYTSGTLNVTLITSAASIEPAATVSGIVTDAAGNSITSNSTATSGKFGLDLNLLSILGTAPTSPGKVDAKAADGDLATIGAKADAKSTATDTTAVSVMQVLKEISAMEQAPASRAITNFPSTVDTNTGNASASTIREAVATNNPAIPTWGHGATGSAVPSGATYAGVQNSSGMSGLISCDKTATYDASTNGLTQIVAAPGSSKQTYICGYEMHVGGTSTNVALYSGTKTTTDCDTSQTQLTPMWQFAANGGRVALSPFWLGLKDNATNQQTCVKTSAGNAVQVMVYYTQF